MDGIVAVTDQGWYEHLLSLRPAEVNFWAPSDRRPVRAPDFSPFFFKLKAPNRAIAGFGYFTRWTSLPDWLAWESFGQANGCSSLAEMRSRIAGIRERIHYVGGGLNNIGCVLIAEPTFFDEDAWVAEPRDWSVRTVSGKRYDLTAGEGRRVWEACLERAEVRPIQPVDESGMMTRFGAPQIVTPRLGQGTFRVLVTDAYDRSCSATGEHSLPALEAAHIQPYAHDGPHQVDNGLLLRADLHRLFDQGYITVGPSYQIEVSARLRTDYQNGRSYYPLHGTQLRVPRQPQLWPSPNRLRWHNDAVYLG